MILSIFGVKLWSRRRRERFTLESVFPGHEWTSRGSRCAWLRPDKQKRGELWAPQERLTALTHPPPRKRRRRGQEGYIRKLRLFCVVSRIKFSAVPRVMPLASFQH